MSLMQAERWETKLEQLISISKKSRSQIVSQLAIIELGRQVNMWKAASMLMHQLMIKKEVDWVNQDKLNEQDVRNNAKQKLTEIQFILDNFIDVNLESRTENSRVMAEGVVKVRDMITPIIHETNKLMEDLDIRSQ